MTSTGRPSRDDVPPAVEPRWRAGAAPPTRAGPPAARWSGSRPALPAVTWQRPFVGWWFARFITRADGRSAMPVRDYVVWNADGNGYLHPHTSRRSRQTRP